MSEYPPVPPLPTPLRSEAIAPTARLYVDRQALVAGLSPRGGVVAEIGVAFGDFSQFIIDSTHPRRFDAYDVFKIHTMETFWGKPTTEWLHNMTHRDFFEDRFKEQVAAGTVRVIEGDSAECVANQPSQTYDMIYVDGGHSLAQVQGDTRAALHAIKEDGLLIFNDYIIYDYWHHKHYGIVHVVNDLLDNSDWQIVGFAFRNDMFCDIALKRP